MPVRMGGIEACQWQPRSATERATSSAPEHVREERFVVARVERRDGAYTAED